MKETGFVERLVDFILGHPKKILALSLLTALGIAFGAKFLTPNFGYRVWFTEGNPKLVQFDAFERKFGSDERSVVVVHSPSGIFDLESAQLLSDMTADFWLAPEVIRVDSLSNFNWVHAEEDEILVEPLIPDDEPLTSAILDERKEIALKHPSIVNYLISKDGKTALIYPTLKPSLEGTPDYEKVANGFREVIQKYEGRGDHVFHLTGNPILNHAFKESTEKDMATLVPFVLIVTLVFLVLSFRRMAGVLFPVIVIAVTIATTMGWGGWLGFEINNTTAIVPQFMIAISIAVAVHILVTFFHFYNQGMDRVEALRFSLIKNFRPTLLTSLSTAIGFFSFSTSGVPPIAGMGQMAGYGTLLSWLITYFVLAPIVYLVPLKAKPKKGPANASLAPSAFSLRFTEILYKLRAPIIVSAVALLMGSIYLASKVPVSSDPFKYFAPDFPIRVANDFVEANVGGPIGAEIVIDSGRPEGIKEPEFLKKVESFQNWLNSYPFVTKTVSIVDILKDMNKTLNGGREEAYTLPETKEAVAQQLFLYTMNLPQGMNINDRVTIKNDSLRLTSMWTIHDSATVLKTIDEIEAKGKEMGLNAHVTGKFPLYQSNNTIVVESFKVSISLAILLVCLLLIFGLKSIKVGLFSMIPNTLPLVVGAGFIQLYGETLNIGTVIVGSVCLGIAVDDTIHFLANFKKYTDAGDSVKHAIAKVFTHTAPALIVTTLVLVAAFATFAFASFVPNQNFGIFVAVILAVALFADLTFLPALLMSVKMFGPKETSKSTLLPATDPQPTDHPSSPRPSSPV